MKKVLLASTALIGFAGMAAADVTLSGSGRFGLVYNDDGTTSDTNLSYRLRFNIDASTETDSGVKFGGRIRLQYDMNGDGTGDVVDTGEGAAEVNAAMLYAETGVPLNRTRFAASGLKMSSRVRGLSWARTALESAKTMIASD